MGFSRPFLIASALVGSCFGASPADAHPPYERTDRVMTLSDGRRVSLVRSYVDGIFFTDPVKFVIRNEQERTIAETEFGRDLAVLCRRGKTCAVFRYDGALSILPTNIWSLHEGVLQPTRSRPLVALGVVAPLLDDPGGYLFAVLSLLPLSICVVAWNGGEKSGCLVGFAVVAAMAYGFLWLYVAALLSRVLLPLLVVAAAGVAATFFVGRRVSLAMGATESGIWRGARFLMIAFAVLGAVLLLAGLGTCVYMGSLSSGLSFDDVPVQTPLGGARLTRRYGVTREVFAQLADGVAMTDVVNVDLLHGFKPSMSREEAAASVGPPSGRWDDPVYGIESSYYDRPGGRVSLVRRGDEWTSVAHPSNCPPESVFRDERIRAQVVAWLPPGGTVQVNLRSSTGDRGVTVWLSRQACTHFVMTGGGAPYGGR